MHFNNEDRLYTILRFIKHQIPLNRSAVTVGRQIKHTTEHKTRFSLKQPG